jgi:hypothetical protein
VTEFVERLRDYDGTASELAWPESLPAHRLTCELLVRALRLHGGAGQCLEAVIEVGRSLARPEALRAIAERMWDLVPHRGLYPKVSGEPTRESLPAWAAATVADPRWFSEALDDSIRIAAYAACDEAKRAVLAAALQRQVPDAPQIAWQAALELPRRRGLAPHPADDARARILGAPEAEWQAVLEDRAWEAERVWQNHWLASLS